MSFSEDDILTIRLHYHMGVATRITARRLGCSPAAITNKAFALGLQHPAPGRRRAVHPYFHREIYEALAQGVSPRRLMYIYNIDKLAFRRLVLKWRNSPPEKKRPFK